MFLLINKPKGWTSHDVVNRIRKITGIKKVGHGGTLDPNATGLLILGIGRESTKKLSGPLLHKDKTYIAEIVLGEERDTDDVQGIVTKKYLIKKNPNLEFVEKTLKTFIGDQMQTPPDYSAIKIKGKEAFKLARAGMGFKLQPRSAKIYTIVLKKYKFPLLVIEVNVSSGTYIRSLARDLGKKLNTGAFLTNLQRVKIGNSLLSDASDLDKLNEDNWRKFVIDFEST
jgi:tRNA pseudouridine55 synthase